MIIATTTETTTTAPTVDAVDVLAARAELRRRAYLVAGLSGLHWETALGALEHGADRIRKTANRAAFLRAVEQLGFGLPIVDAAEKLGIELP